MSLWMGRLRRGLRLLRFPSPLLLSLATQVGCIGGTTNFRNADGSSAIDAADGVQSTPAFATQAVPFRGLQRISAVEFDNSVRDITGTSLQFADKLPLDGTLENFDNSAAGVTLSAAWLDAFVDATGQIGDEVAASGNATGAARTPIDRVAPCAAAVDADKDACLRATARAFGRRAWRRQLSETEIDALVRLASADAAQLPRQVGTLVSAVLASPYFLFRTEGQEGPAVPTPQPLTGYELAGRLAAFLWRSTPDEALLAAAEDGSLLTDAGLRAQTDRMLLDPRAQQLVTGFGQRWLYLNKLATSEPSAALYPDFNPSVRDAMAEESRLFLNDFLLGGTPLNELVTAPYTYLNDTLAGYYGLTKPGSASAVRVSLDPNGPRGGILTQGSVLLVGSTGVVTSPIRRGKLIIGQMLCSSPPPPPANVPAAPSGDANVTTNRQLLEEHTHNASCAACHVRMDDLGFAFENFGSDGRIQATDHGAPVDTSGNYMGKAAFQTNQQMARMLAQDPLLHQCFTKMLFTYAMGRAVVDEDAFVLGYLDEKFVASNQDTRELIAQIALTKPFRYRVGK